MSKLLTITPMRIVLIATSLILLILIGYPLAMLLASSFSADADGAFGLQNYVRVVTDPAMYVALGNTLIIAGGATLISVVAGVPLAWLITRTDLPGRRAVMPLVLVAYLIPGYLGAVAYIILLGPRSGVLNKLAMDTFGLSGPVFDIYSLAGIALVTAFNVFPLVVFLLVAALDSIDANLELAAQLLGAGRVRVLFTVTWPVVLPALLSAMLLVFVQSMALFGAHALLGLPVGIYSIPTRIYTLLNFPPQYGAAAAVSVFIMGLTVLLLFIQRRALARRSFVTVGGKAAAAGSTKLGGFRWPAFALVHLFLAFAVYLPILALLVVSFSKARSAGLTLDNATLDNYIHVLFEYSPTARSLANSLLLGIVAATAGTILGASVAYMNNRLSGRSRPKVLDYLATIPLGLPGIVLAVALVLAWINVPVAVYGTFVIICIAATARFLPFGARSADSAIRQIDPSLEEAARISGASWLRSVVGVTLPLMRGGLIAGWAFIFVQSIQDLSTMILLFNVRSQPVSVAIYQLAEQGSLEDVAALSIVVLSVTFVVVALVQKVTGKSLAV